jgi:hypothetical protein
MRERSWFATDILLVVKENILEVEMMEEAKAAHLSYG